MVLASFNPRIGARAKITLTQRNGKPIPFGALVSDETGGGGIVGDAGEVFMPGLKPEGMLKVVWGHSASQQCMATYQLEKKTEKRGISYTHAECL
ncbi:hypothetical protein LAW66_22710 [Escherichia coli]|nr:hypothetical protein [Escherichia coli]